MTQEQGTGVNNLVEVRGPKFLGFVLSSVVELTGFIPNPTACLLMQLGLGEV